MGAKHSRVGVRPTDSAEFRGKLQTEITLLVRLVSQIAVYIVPGDSF